MVCDEVLEIVRPFGLRSFHSCKKSAKLASLAAGQPEATSQASQPGSQSKPSNQIQQAAASSGQQSHGGMAANLQRGEIGRSPELSEVLIPRLSPGKNPGLS